jgi:hypothetical protein
MMQRMKFIERLHFRLPPRQGKMRRRLGRDWSREEECYRQKIAEGWLPVLTHFETGVPWVRWVFRWRKKL